MTTYKFNGKDCELKLENIKELERTDYVLVWWENTLKKEGDTYAYDGQALTYNQLINEAVNIVTPESINDIQLLRTKAEPLDIIANGPAKLKRLAQFLIVNREGGIQPILNINNNIVRSMIATEELDNSVRIAGLSQYKLNQIPDWILGCNYNQPKLLDLIEAIKSEGVNG